MLPGAVLLLAAVAVLLVRPRAEHRLVAVAGRDRGPTFRDQVGRLVRRAAARVGVGPGSRRRRAQARVRVLHALGALAAELEAGQPPTAALIRCAGSPSAWPTAAGIAALGGDVAAGLAVDAERDPVLRQLAACWQVAADTGTGLAQAVTRMTDAARAAEDIRVDLEGQLAGPRATARLLALLPLVGLGFGVMLGADPVSWLTGSVWGWGCLASGALLTGCGMWWTGRIAVAVERRL